MCKGPVQRGKAGDLRGELEGGWSKVWDVGRMKLERWAGDTHRAAKQATLRIWAFFLIALGSSGAQQGAQGQDSVYTALQAAVRNVPSTEQLAKG